MSILARADGTPRTFAENAASPEDTWPEALLKLFPAEVYGAYMLAMGYLTDVESTPTLRIAYWGLFFAGLVATLIWLVAKWDDDPVVRREELRYAWPQLILSAFAFTVWAFFLGGAFAQFPWWTQWLGSLALTMGALLLTGLNKLLGQQSA